MDGNRIGVDKLTEILAEMHCRGLDWWDAFMFPKKVRGGCESGEPALSLPAWLTTLSFGMSLPSM